MCNRAEDTYLYRFFECPTTQWIWNSATFPVIIQWNLLLPDPIAWIDRVWLLYKGTKKLGDISDQMATASYTKKETVSYMEISQLCDEGLPGDIFVRIPPLIQQNFPRKLTVSTLLHIFS